MGSSPNYEGSGKEDRAEYPRRFSFRHRSVYHYLRRATIQRESEWGRKVAISLSNLRRERWYWQNGLSSRTPDHIRTRRNNKNEEFLCDYNFELFLTDKEKSTENLIFWSFKNHLWNVNVLQCELDNRESLLAFLYSDSYFQESFVQCESCFESFNLSRLHSTKFQVILILSPSIIINYLVIILSS